MNGIDAIERLPTGIRGFDPVALGGLPKGRATLVTGTTGSGKTLFAVEFLARGILHSGEPGVFVTFEESAEDIRRNFASLGFPIRQWEDDGKWAFVDASADIALEAPVIGTFDFGALEARIGHAADRIGAARVSVDALDALFTRFADPAIVRHEIARMVYALEMTGATSIITAERSGEHDGVSRYGVEEFVVDNVITLRNVLADERRRRTVEIVKFRGAPHRTGEWLFAIDPTDGLVVIPLAFLALPLAATSRVRVSSGLPPLDEMCGGGFFKDAITLVTGPSGVGKTLLSLKFITAAVAADERCLACSFDDAREQVKRNAAGWGMDIDAMEASGLLRLIAGYPETASLEDHFIRIRRAIEEHEPERLVIDTISALERIASSRALLDFILALGALARQRGITTLLTSAPPGRLTRRLMPSIAEEIASLTDVMITLRYFERAGQVHRAIVVTQTRGSAHDPRIRLATIDSDGMHIGERISAHIGILASGETIQGETAAAVETESHRQSDE